MIDSKSTLNRIALAQGPKSLLRDDSTFQSSSLRLPTQVGFFLQGRDSNAAFA
jgi:hypothetical protein